MVSDRFELAGWTTHLLGANVPAIEMVRAARALEADAVVLSASTHFHRLALKTYVEQLTGALPGLRVWVGGAAFARDHDGWPAEMVLVPSAIPSLAERMA
jgi:methanogenic corrinoid protein MtbC1